MRRKDNRRIERIAEIQTVWRPLRIERETRAWMLLGPPPIGA